LNSGREFSNIDNVSAVIKGLTTDVTKYGPSVLISSSFDSILRLPGFEQAMRRLINPKDASKSVTEDIRSRLTGLFKEKIRQPFGVTTPQGKEEGFLGTSPAK
jgi:hypothetical protein